jgi:hypothetical protein
MGTSFPRVIGKKEVVMRSSKILSIAAVAAILVALVAPLSAQEPTPEQQQAMDAYVKLMAPNENHEFLKNLAGEWTVTTTIWPQPGAPPVSSEGTASSAMVLGGRFLEMKFKGMMFGQPFDGLEIVGYDTVKKQYVTLWIDNTSTMFYELAGTREKNAKAIHDRGAWYDPMAGGDSPVHAVTTVVGPDEYTFELFMVGPDGKEIKSMEYRALRAK